MKKVDVIIPVYRPDEKLIKIIKRLHAQTYPVNRLILINTGKEYFDEFFKDSRLLSQYDDLMIRHITPEEFDHGATRRYGVSLSDADFFICMTDDAVPADNRLVEELIRPLEEKKASVSYARQLPGKDSDIVEKTSRRFNYPARSCIKSLADLDTLGIKTFFCSNACAAYDRDVYEALGGFKEHMIFNEDMVYAAGVIDAGGSIAYVAEARVIHTHHYTALQQLKRNFDLGVSQAQFPEVFERVSSSSEGMRMIKMTVRTLIKKGRILKIPGVMVHSAFKLAGYKLGRAYKKLPRGMIMMLTMNRMYWKK